MKNKIINFYDTSSLLEINFNNISLPYIITKTTIQELENIKSSTKKTPDVRSKAQKVLNYLNSMLDEIILVNFSNKVIDGILKKFSLECTNDNIILASMYYYKLKSKDTLIEFYSEDVAFRVIGKTYFNLNINTIETISSQKYKGYLYFKGTTQEINDFYYNLDYSKLYTNQYIITENTDINKITEQRYNGKELVGLKLPKSSYVKGKNSLQRCALDLLNNDNITIVAIMGTYGSGKTFLTTQMALYNVLQEGKQSFILGVREAIGEGAQVGFLKGTWEDKTEHFFKPIEQQLDGGAQELESLLQKGVLETNIPFYMKGTTYNNTVLLVDEAEDLSKDILKLIGTRVGDNSKIYFSGDYKQSVINKTQSNPYALMCEELKGNSKFGCIYLDDDVRSDTSKIFANLFE